MEKNSTTRFNSIDLWLPWGLRLKDACNMSFSAGLADRKFWGSELSSSCLHSLVCPGAYCVTHGDGPPCASQVLGLQSCHHALKAVLSYCLGLEGWLDNQERLIFLEIMMVFRARAMPSELHRPGAAHGTHTYRQNFK